MARTNRREFIKRSLAAGAFLAIAGPGSGLKILGANDRIRIAVAGLHSRGKNHIDGWLEQDNVEIVYLIDPDKNVLAECMKDLEERTQGRFTCKGITDIREALDDKNLDAISIAAPNHWHTLMTIWAAQAGKHVYVEKPISHDLYEGRAAIAAQKKYGVVIQHGTQRRSSAKNAGLNEMIRSGTFGELKIAYGYCCKIRQGIGFAETKTAPAYLDWNLWRGPAKVEQYNDNYVHYNWHWFWKTGNGDLNNQGTHQLDMAFWALDQSLTYPIRTMSIGGRFVWKDQGETPNTMFSIAEYPNGQYVMFNVRNIGYDGYQRQVENEYYFEDGGKIVNEKREGENDDTNLRKIYYPAGSSNGEILDIPDGKLTPGGTYGSFINACRANDPNMVNGNVFDAHRTCAMGHLLNNSYRLGKKMPFNSKVGSFGDNKDEYEYFMELHEIMNKGVGLSEDKNQYTVGPWLTFNPETERHTGEHANEANALLRNEDRTGFQVPDINQI